MAPLLSSCGIRSWHTLVNESHYWPIHPIAYTGSSPTFTSSILQNSVRTLYVRLRACTPRGGQVPADGLALDAATAQNARGIFDRCGYCFIGKLL